MTKYKPLTKEDIKEELTTALFREGFTINKKVYLDDVRSAVMGLKDKIIQTMEKRECSEAYGDSDEVNYSDIHNDFHYLVDEWLGAVLEEEKDATR